MEPNNENACPIQMMIKVLNQFLEIVGETLMLSSMDKMVCVNIYEKPRERFPKVIFWRFYCRFY
jgi:hypothetical protein